MATLFYLPRLARLGAHEQYVFRLLLRIAWIKFLRPLLLILLGAALAIPLSLGISMALYCLGEWAMKFFPTGFSLW